MKSIIQSFQPELIDQKSKYSSSVLGFLWAFIKPIVIVSIFIFVFEYGFRTTPNSGDNNFILWLLCGMIPWFVISESIISATNRFLIFFIMK